MATIKQTAAAVTRSWSYCSRTQRIEQVNALRRQVDEDGLHVARPYIPHLCEMTGNVLQPHECIGEKFSDDDDWYSDQMFGELQDACISALIQLDPGELEPYAALLCEGFTQAAHTYQEREEAYCAGGDFEADVISYLCKLFKLVGLMRPEAIQPHVGSCRYELANTFSRRALLLATNRVDRGAGSAGAAGAPRAPAACAAAAIDEPAAVAAPPPEPIVARCDGSETLKRAVETLKRAVEDLSDTAKRQKVEELEQGEVGEAIDSPPKDAADLPLPQPVSDCLPPSQPSTSTTTITVGERFRSARSAAWSEETLGGTSSGPSPGKSIASQLCSMMDLKAFESTEDKLIEAVREHRCVVPGCKYDGFNLKHIRDKSDTVHTAWRRQNSVLIEPMGVAWRAAGCRGDRYTCHVVDEENEALKLSSLYGISSIQAKLVQRLVDPMVAAQEHLRARDADPANARKRKKERRENKAGMEAVALSRIAAEAKEEAAQAKAEAARAREAAAQAEATEEMETAQAAAARRREEVLASLRTGPPFDPQAFMSRFLAFRQYVEMLLRFMPSKTARSKAWRLSVRRDRLCASVIEHFTHGFTVARLFQRTEVKFTDAFGIEEDGRDMGGLTAEMYTCFFREILSPDAGTFEGVQGDDAGCVSIGLLPAPSASRDALLAAGRAMCKCLLDDQPLGRGLGRFVFEYLADAHERRVFDSARSALAALSDYDPDLAQRWAQLLVEPVDGLTLDLFDPEADDVEVAAEPEAVGHAIVAGCRHRLLTSRHASLQALLEGFVTFEEHVDLRLQLGALTSDELVRMLRGNTELTVDDLLGCFSWPDRAGPAAAADAGFASVGSDVPCYLREILEDTETPTALSSEQRLHLLEWATALTALPCGGLKEPIQLRLYEGATDGDLPECHTCTHEVHLPPYSSSQKLREKLLKAVEHRHDGFGRE